MEPTQPVDDMTHDEVTALIGGLTEGEMRLMLTFVAGRYPETFDWALAKVRPAGGPSTGEGLTGMYWDNLGSGGTS